MSFLNRFVSLTLIGSIALLCHARSVSAQAYKEQVGFNRLQSELISIGDAIPDGTGVTVGLVEANFPGNAPLHTYRVNVGNQEFLGKSVTDLSNMNPANVSSHATSVAQHLFGNSTSMTPGVSAASLYYANDFVFSKQRLGTLANPDSVTVDVLNHSYIGNFVDPPNPPDLLSAAQANARMDFTVQRDQFTNVVALNNGTGALPHIYGQSYNSIVVGLTNGNHSRGSTTLGVTGRTKPDIVAPLGATSFSTPVVASAATLLHSAAQSFGYTDARAPEAIKAIIMAGADKSAIPSWSNTETRPLDSIYGAGELDVYNSYQILEGGSFEGSTTFTVGDSGLQGWDYGEISATQDLFWNFNTVAGIETASILVTWNADYANANGDFSQSDFRLANMRLSLHSYNGLTLGTELFFSDSPVDNVEHLYLQDLDAGRYTLRLSSNINSKFGLAWGITAVPEPSTLVLLGSIVSVVFLRRRISSKPSMVNRCNEDLNV